MPGNKNSSSYDQYILSLTCFILLCAGSVALVTAYFYLQLQQFDLMPFPS